MDNKVFNDVINSVRVLSAEAIERAKSGHPGTPLGAAPLIATLYGKLMKIAPTDPNWINRDRFVLSSGHASMMLYSILHLCGYNISIDDLKQFRQEGSITPGHPEINATPGVDASTGPLGQGVANAVGMALAEKILANRFNKPDVKIIDHYTYAFCGDGCMMEGIENEAASLAAIWKLNKLILIYDSNNITIEGNTSIAFTEDVKKRHEALGWNVIEAGSMQDTKSLFSALNLAKECTDKPSLIIVNSTIGYGSPLEGTSKVHGAPLGADGIKALKEKLGWSYDEFTLPESINEFKEYMINKGKDNLKAYNTSLEQYKAKYLDDYVELNKWLDGSYNKKLISSNELLNITNDKDMATRNLSGECLCIINDYIPNLVGGSADLGPSNCTIIKGKEYFNPSTSTGSLLHYGIREHAMAAISNGIALHGGLVPFCATFFVFSDYMKYSMRMSAMMHLPVIYILTHDSIGVGEDGPTHQPIEQLTSLRATPGIYTFRPSDYVEMAAAYEHALKVKAPTAIIASRQKLKCHKLSNKALALKGGYILSEGFDNNPKAIIMASGSEVEKALEAQELLKRDGISVRVVSIPCMELFEEQPIEYKRTVLPNEIRARLAVEAGSSMSWGKYVGLDGDYICLDHYGESAPAAKLFNKYGFTAKNIANKITAILNK